MPRPLSELLRALPGFEHPQPLPAVEIEQITADSRQVQPGALFVAVPGATVDGHRYIPGAVTRGAAAIAGSLAPAELPDGPPAVPYIQVPDSRMALAWLAAALHDFPGRQLRLVGVTGTDGKTTTANTLYHLLSAAGRRPGIISTVSARVGSRQLDTGYHVTTPDAPDVQRYLAEMVAAGCDIAVLETTSHGLHQGRVAACDFDVAVVTNVTHEHLDYHGSWAAYLDAKAGLFRSLSRTAHKPGQAKVAVLNADDRSYESLRAIPAERQISYGLDAAGADLRAENLAFWPDRTSFALRWSGRSRPVESRLAGRFNVYNSLAALGAGLALDLPLEPMIAALADLPGVEGRLERIDRGQDFLVIVDFAHTPISLARSLEAVRLMTAGRLIVVFGSAGLRDVEKRTLMPETAIRLADMTLLTAEDPRSESLPAILSQMAEGAARAGGREGHDFERIPDRTRAIQRALDLARPGDVVLVSGKGHERSMCFGDVEHPWRDRDVVAWALERLLGQAAGPPPFWLPTSDWQEKQENG